VTAVAVTAVPMATPLALLTAPFALLKVTVPVTTEPASAFAGRMTELERSTSPTLTAWVAVLFSAFMSAGSFTLAVVVKVPVAVGETVT